MTLNELCKVESGAFETLAGKIGANAALKLCAFYSSQSNTCYVPEAYISGHRLEKLIGEQAFISLILHYGGETICTPKLGYISRIERLGTIVNMMNHGVTDIVIKNSIKYDPSYTGKIISWCRETGFAENPTKYRENLKLIEPTLREMTRRLMHKILAGEFPIIDERKKQACSLLAKAGFILDEIDQKKTGIVLREKSLFIVSSLVQEADQVLNTEANNG